MKKLKNIILTLSFLGCLGFAALPQTVVAVTVIDCPAGSTSTICDEYKSGKKDVQYYIKTIINWFLYITGAAAVVMIIYSGFMYATSSGDANNVTKAKTTLMYSVIGLVVASLAWVIVNFALNIFS